MKKYCNESHSWLARSAKWYYLWFLSSIKEIHLVVNLFDEIHSANLQQLQVNLHFKPGMNTIFKTCLTFSLCKYMGGKNFRNLYMYIHTYSMCKNKNLICIRICQKAWLETRFASPLFTRSVIYSFVMQCKMWDKNLNEQWLYN